MEYVDYMFNAMGCHLLATQLTYSQQCNLVYWFFSGEKKRAYKNTGQCQCDTSWRKHLVTKNKMQTKQTRAKSSEKKEQKTRAKVRIMDTLQPFTVNAKTNTQTHQTIQQWIHLLTMKMSHDVSHTDWNIIYLFYVLFRVLALLCTTVLLLLTTLSYFLNIFPISVSRTLPMCAVCGWLKSHLQKLFMFERRVHWFCYSIH